MSLSLERKSGPGPPVSGMRLADAELGDLYPIGLECLYLDLRAPCDLYRRLQDGEMVFFARRGIPFDQEARDRLHELGVSELYIREDDVPRFFTFIRETLEKIVRDNSVSPQKKAEAVHVSCMETMRRAYADPRAVFLQQAHEVIAPTVDLIVHDDVATRALVQLTAYDHCTYVHSTNVGIFGIALARIMYGQESVAVMERLGAGFFLHDLGKCRIPVEILNKPGSLTPKERRLVNRHPRDGYEILRLEGFMTDEAEILTLQHHEREDGEGYPAGLTSRDIHPYARICRLVDIYEALTADRPYHKRRTTFEALKFMQEQILTDMDQELLRNFVLLFAKS
ncbi:HD domain-containing protein [Geothermobacter ehrlichii]|uniref:HD domain-containing protein n=1 Tax=Geothermobacter ehrlichii TaxID=213224 RepID=A0A5D3WKG8_9BACT|nr:HD domain-containing phosphohydrolase [Geothermobacter ehrlichii]TYO97645.1 HD domain-containing protein [Geothermobacter ehrlichii]